MALWIASPILPVEIVLPPVRGVTPLLRPVGYADLSANTTARRKRAADDDLGTVEPGEREADG